MHWRSRWCSSSPSFSPAATRFSFPDDEAQQLQVVGRPAINHEQSLDSATWFGVHQHHRARQGRHQRSSQGRPANPRRPTPLPPQLAHPPEGGGRAPFHTGVLSQEQAQAHSPKEPRVLKPITASPEAMDPSNHASATASATSSNNPPHRRPGAISGPPGWAAGWCRSPERAAAGPRPSTSTAASRLAGC